MPTAEQIIKMACPNGILITPSTERKYRCPKCEDKGYIITDRITLTTEPCECFIREQRRKRLERSGLNELFEKYTFDNFKTSESWQKQAKEKALAFLDAPKSAWFFIGGRSGSGKTHLCTAMCKSLIDGGRNLKYFKWRMESPKLKALINDAERYDAEMKKLSEIPVLYIDDFWKGSVSDADINLSYQFLNERYNTQRRTIISSERSIEDIVKIDEAVAGRIYERAKDFCVKTPDTINANYRFRSEQFFDT